MKIIVVTVNYGTPSHVAQELEALVPELRNLKLSLNQNAESPVDAECWVVDNCSPDDSVRQVSKFIEDMNYEDCVRLIPFALNGGFSSGNNVAFRKARLLAEEPDFFYLLNPDAVVVPGTLQKLSQYLVNNPHVDVVGGPLFDSTGKVVCGAFRFPGLLGTLIGSLRIGFVSRLLSKYKVPIEPIPDTPEAVGWVGGANMMIRKSALDNVGVFDEGYFLYFEEVDLCKRIHENGGEVHYLPDAGVVHEAGASTGLHEVGFRLPRYWHYSRSRYLDKFFGASGLLLINLVAIGALALQRFHFWIRRKSLGNPHFLKDLIRYNFFPERGGKGSAAAKPIDPDISLDKMPVVKRRPHYRRVDDKVYFMASRNPMLTLDSSAIAAWECLDKSDNLSEIASEYGEKVKEAIKSFIEAGICDAFIPFEQQIDRKKVLIFEPHSDDAALSIGATMWQRRDACEFTLVTLGSRSNYTSYYFSSHGPLDVSSVTELRNYENEIFMRHCFGKHVASGENEATLRYRDGDWSRDFLKDHKVSVSIFNNHFGTEQERDRWTDVVCDHLCIHSFEEVWIPMGVGTHSDHGLTRDACLAALKRKESVVAGKAVYMYQDVPYDGQFDEHKRSIVSTLERNGAVLEHFPVEVSSSYSQKLHMLGIFGSQFKLPSILDGVVSSATPSFSEGCYEHLWKLSRLPTTLDPASLFIGMPYLKMIRPKVSQWLEKHKSAKRIRVLLLIPSGQWRRHIKYLLASIPDAHFEVYATPGCQEEIYAFKNERISYVSIPAGITTWGWLAPKLLFTKATPMLFVAGVNRPRLAYLVSALWVQHDVLVTRTLEDFHLAGEMDII